MAIAIELTAELEEQLRAEAARRGVEPAAYARQLVEVGLRPPRCLDEILAPFRQQVAESGLTDAELDTLFEDAREQVFRDQQPTPR